MTNDTTMSSSAPFTRAPDMLTATALAPREAEQELRLEVILATLRDSFIYDNFSDFELMLGAQATVLNAAFNRMMGRALGGDTLREEMIEPALRAQRSACAALNTLCRLRADYRAGKRTEGQ